jgi:hypothetical protein
MIKELLKVATKLDSLGLNKEADAIDKIIRKISMSAMNATDYNLIGLEDDDRPLGGSEESESAYYEALSDRGEESDYQSAEGDPETERYREAVRSLANARVSGTGSEDSGEVIGFYQDQLYAAARALRISEEEADAAVTEAEDRLREIFGSRRRMTY